MVDFTGTESCIVFMDNGLCQESQRRTTYRLGGGGEYNLANKVPLRLGYLYDSNTNAHHISGGLGYLDLERGFGLDLSLRQQVSAGTQTVALLGFRVIKN
jgi:opacity protein-like surface antigen